VPVVAITGSNGKTTTREMTAAVVGQRFPTLSSRGNFNNEIGLPLTLLKLDHGHKCAVVELGMNAPGEIAKLGEMCMPDIGVITNIGPAHLKGVGSIEGVMHAKGDRDRGKRPLMGEIAGRLCDLAIVTSDNPRTEDPEKIIEQILSGLKKTCKHKYSLSSLKTDFDKKGYVIEPDRRNAIKLGIAASRQGDTVLIAGKGHETYQILSNKTISFDDRKEAKQALLNEAQST